MKIMHPEFAIYKHLNGVKIKANRSTNGNFPLTMSDLLALPYNVYAYDRDNRFVQSNQLSANMCGEGSIKNMLNKDIFSITTHNHAARILNNNKKVLASNFQYIIDEEFYRLSDKQTFTGVSIKLPIYDDNNEIEGVIGVSNMFEKSNNIGLSEITAFINSMLEKGLLNLQQQASYKNLISPVSQFQDIYFTKREEQVIMQLIKGITAKMIAKKLNISYRTVEVHINNLKRKAEVRTKVELIEKLIDAINQNT